MWIATGDPAKGIPPAPDRPPAMLAFEESRRGLSGRVDWIVEPEGRPEATLQFVSRYALNGDWIFENRGDAEGWTVFSSPGKGMFKYPQLYLRAQNGDWHFQETRLDAKYWPAGNSEYVENRAKDARWLGIAPYSASVEPRKGFAFLYDDPGHKIVDWSVEVAGDIHQVHGRCDSGAEFIFQINSAKGWNAESVVFVSEFGNVQEVRCSLKKFGSVWFPESLEYLKDGKATERIRVTAANLGPENAPERFTLADLGAEPGTQMTIIADPIPPAYDSGNGPPIWNGGEITSWQRWLNDVQSGRCRSGPSIEKFQHGGAFDSPYMTEHEREARRIASRDGIERQEVSKHRGLWEQYVRSFIQRYRLNDEQTHKALQLLDRSQKTAQEWIDRHQAQIRTVLNELQNARESGDVPLADRRLDEFEKLMQPVDKIFRNELKRGLEKIPTREQLLRTAERLAEQADRPAGGKPR